MFAGHLRIRLPGDAVVLQETVQLGIVYPLPAQQIDTRFPENADILARIELGHEINNPRLREPALNVP